MDDPTDLEMATTREMLRRNPRLYLEAVATHHSRVARIAVDMRKVMDTWEFSADHSAPVNFAELMLKAIEQSFAHEFGFKLRSPIDVSAGWEASDEATDAKQPHPMSLPWTADDEAETKC
jgi:hypothetical protein